MRICNYIPMTVAALIVVLTGTECLPSLDYDIYLNEQSDGTSISAPVSSKIVLELVSNASTGYGWQIVELDQNILELTSDTYIPPVSDYWAEPTAGAAGTERWEFVARSTGTTNLRLEYVFVGFADDRQPGGTFQCSIEVVPSS